MNHPEDSNVENGMVLYHEPDELPFDDDEPEVCFVCGEESDDRVCDACRNAVTVERATAYGHDNRTDVSINGYYAMLFDDSDIDEILAREVKERQICPVFRPELLGKAEDFCIDGDLSDLQDYVDWLEAHDGV